MDYKTPMYCELGSIGGVMNPLYNQPPVRLVESPIAFQATRNIADPGAGYFETKHAGLDGRHFNRNFFEPHQGGQLYGWRDAMDVMSAASFLFPA